MKKSRLKEIIKVFLKHKLQKGLTPQKVCLVMEELGPTYVKIGQILSTREDMIPKIYCEEFEKLKSNVKPLLFEEVYSAISKELDIEEVFTKIIETPLGSASIGQVHRATLKTGEEVVVKVMRPNIYETVVQDFAILKQAIKTIKLITDETQANNLNIILEETFETMKKEMDFTNELENLELFAKMLEKESNIKVPKTYKEYSSKNILVMEYIEGIKIDEYEKLKNQGYDLKQLCKLLVENFAKQIIEHGTFHADPHGGNIIIKDGKIVWLDLGMVGTISKRHRELCKRAISAIIDENAYELKSIILSLCSTTESINHAKLYRDIERVMEKFLNVDLKDMDMGKLLEELITIAKNHQLMLPRGITMLERSILIIQKVVGLLDKEASVITIFTDLIKKNSALNFKENFDIIATTKKAFTSCKKAIDIPSQIYDVLDQTIKGEKHTNIEIVNSKETIASIGKLTISVIISIVLGGLLIFTGIMFNTLIDATNYKWLQYFGIFLLILSVIAIFILLIILFITIIIGLKKRFK